MSLSNRCNLHEIFDMYSDSSYITICYVNIMYNGGRTEDKYKAYHWKFNIYKYYLLYANLVYN